MKKSLIFLMLLLFTCSLVNAQTVMITGTVTSQEDGAAIPGVNVTVKGTTVGAITDMDGKYQVNAPSGATTLVFSFIGMTEQEVLINGRTTINVSLSTDLESLDEVVVVAYGTARKSSFTGSAEVVKADKLAKIQTASVAKALEGASAGVQVTGGTGQPGSSANIRIRGIGSVNASSAPLYVVDGAPYDGDLSSINTNDIESITVLKDATSAALYGARGANGVIIVTTRKGSAGKATVNFKSNVGAVTRAVPEYDRVSIPEYYELMWEGWRNALVNANGQTPSVAATTASGGTANGIVGKLGYYNSYDVPNDQLIGTDGKLNPNANLLYYDDWNAALDRTGIRQDYNLSLSGGNDRSTYFASLAYLNETGIVKWSDYNRVTGRVGATGKVTDWFKMDATLSASTSKQMGFLAEGTYTTNPFYYARMMGPIYPIYQRTATGDIMLDAIGKPVYDMGGGTGQYKWAGHNNRPYAPNSNLILTLPLDERSTALNTFSARVGSEISFLKDFKLRISGNTDMNNYLGTTLQNHLYGDAQSVRGRSTKSYTRSNSFTLNEVLTWSKTIGEHGFSLLAGHENYLYTRNYISATRTGFAIPTSELVAGGTAEGSTSYTDEYALEGYLAQANYDYADKYYFSGSFRTDGSSRFFEDVRWGSFWSIGGSWRVSEENFLKNINWINNLKVKASFGEQGNDNIGNYYGWQSLYSYDDRNNGNLNGAVHSQLENKALQWEKNSNLNAGVEFVMFNRLRGTFEYFVRQSSNLLFSVPLPQSTGLSTKWENIGTMKNNGIEVQLAYDIIQSNDFLWTIDVNGTSYVNEITKMPLGIDGKPKEIISGTKKLSEGHSIYDFWLREYAGVDPVDGSALFYKDIMDGETVTGRETTKDQNAASYYYVGSAIPKLYGGITNTVTWKGISLSALLTYQLGGKMYDSNWASLMHAGAFGSHWSTDILKRWQKPGDITDVPRLQNSYVAATAASSRYLTDASFLSIRNVMLSYTLPSSLVRKIDLQEVRVFTSGDNLGLFSARKGMDPQQSFTGTADFTYIPSRIISFGLNLTF